MKSDATLFLAHKRGYRLSGASFEADGALMGINRPMKLKKKCCQKYLKVGKSRCSSCPNGWCSK